MTSRDNDAKDSGDERAKGGENIKKDEENLVFTVKDKKGLEVVREFLDHCGRLKKQGSKVFVFKKMLEWGNERIRDPKSAAWREVESEFPGYLKEMHQSERKKQQQKENQPEGEA
jgi:spore cortex formation protein SpoVR/YcgB (stage V sporulation)